MNKTIIRIRVFFENVKRSWDYARLGWDNYDWDYSCLLGIIEFKLRRMEKHFRERGVSVDSKEQAAKMADVIALFDRMKDGDWGYAKEAVEEHHDRWGDFGCVKCGGLFCKCSPTGNKWYTTNLGYANAKTDEEQDTAKAERRKIMEDAWEEYMKDMKSAFLMIAENAPEWWD